MADTSTAAKGTFLLRLALGVMFLAHGFYLKVLTFTVPGTVKYFLALGFPEIVAYLVIFGEIAGGIALVLGIYTRAAAVLLIPIMLGAATQHVPNGWLFSNPGGGWEFPAFWAIALVVQAMLGGGARQLDIEGVTDRFDGKFS
ncbi:MAG: DoxX family membrane protein [Alphaproteobacteria bacterium]|nr:DoxX family membrane protein [Alphaproteobacteria bacterium]